MPKELSVIISNRNDITMLVVTIRSCIEALKPIGLDKCEVVVVDDSDPAYYERVQAAIPTGYCRDKTLFIHRQKDGPCLFSAREMAAEKATGKYIVCLDSHMLVGHNSFLDMYNFMVKHDNNGVGFAHAPINWAHQHEKRSRHDRNLKNHELGPWGVAYDHERKITWKGMPWICRREWFLDKDKGLGGYGALASHKVSWGGGDMHIGTKPWLLGFENWAVPTSPCIHIGPFPKTDSIKGDKHSTVVSKKIDDIDKYRVYGSSGNFPHTFGFLVSCYVLGGEAMMKRNKAAITERFGRYINLDEYWQKAIEIGSEEREWLLKRQVMSFEEFLEKQPWAK